MVRSGRTGCGGDVDGVLGGRTNRGGGGIRDRLSRLEDNVAYVPLGTDPNAPLAYAMRLEIHHPIMSTLGDPGVRLNIYVYILNGGLTFPLYTSEKSINWKMTYSFF